MTERYLIIGGNAAGMSAAFKARRMNKEADIVVYEGSNEISVGACGIPYYIAKEFSSLDTMRARSPQDVEKAGITLHLNSRITSLDTEQKRVLGVTTDGAQISDTYTKLVIATGADPVIPPIQGVDTPGVFPVKTLDHGDTIKSYMAKESVREVVIIGGGFIGIEMVESALHLNKKVRLIELQEHLMPRAFDSDIIVHVESYMQELGVALNLGESVSAITGEGRVTGVTTTKGKYPADMVILAAGVHPATQWLENTPLQRGPNGAIVVNNRGETSVPSVFAAGDCALIPHRLTKKPTYVPLATAANKLGRVIGENIAGGSSEYPGTLGSGSFRFNQLEAARVGLSKSEAELYNIPYKSITIEDKNHTNYVAGSGSIWVQLLYNPETFVLLGAQLVGAKGAELRSYPLVIAIEQGLSVKELALADFPYAPPFSRTWDILNIAGSVAK